MSSGGKVLPVRVAVRIRPVVDKEIRDGCQECLDVTPGEPQIVLSGTEKAFTYDYVFDASQSQLVLYETAVQGMLGNLFQGYNVTILAYGQTGSGKTYTMGTVYSSEEGMTDQTGVIPRAMADVFAEIERRDDSEFSVRVSFLEIYKEQLFDLLSGRDRAESQVDIREDCKGIKVAGLTEVPVSNVTETIACLERGGLCRITGATAMNMRSSRSHAIFTVCLEQRVRESGQLTAAKLHLVDLAGSERAKKTQATGTRFAEGVNINRGLLSLGNVISALGENKQPKHVPYRDSKLTRMLQESLGGNSHTLMIACTSPADSNLEETVSTLRYADRARKIKNKPIVNREGSGEMARLRQQVQELQMKLLELQGGAGGGGAVGVPGSPSTASVLGSQNRRLADENRRLMSDLQAAIEENTAMSEKALLAERAAERMKQRLEELYQQTGDTMQQLNQSTDQAANVTLVRDLQTRIMDMQNEQTHHEQELRRVDASRHVPAPAELAAEPAPADDEREDEEDEDELVKQHAMRQAQLNNELLDLNRALAIKESLASDMINSNAQMLSVRQRYEQTTRQLEEQVLALTTERQRLEEALQGARAEATGSKVAEQKRQRVLELEQRIKELQHKMKEQERLVRMKRAADEKVVQLNKEIQNIKQTRVKLIRQMREDGDKFRQWRQKKDREVMQLRAQDRKRQVQLVKMERMHNKQETVLRRKMENAMAANRRLKEVLELQKTSRERRQTAASAAGVTAQLDQELELLVSTRLAQRSLDQLIDDRRRLTAQLQQAEEGLQREDVAADDVAQLTRTKRELQKELMTRNGQISDLQHRLVNVEADGRSSAAGQRWAALTSMADAKQALSHVFEQVVSARTDACARETDARELQTQLDEALQSVEELERESARQRRQFEEQLNRLTLENEEKVLMLLRHMPQPQGCSTPNASFQEAPAATDESAALHERLRLQEREIQRLSLLHDMLAERDAEVAALRAETERLRSELNEAKDQNTTVKATSKRPPAAKAPRKMQQRLALEEILPESEEDEGDNSDDPNDPEWVRTPLFRRINKIKSRASRMARPRGDAGPDSASDSETQLRDASARSSGGAKRDSDGQLRCTCGGKCMRGCACRDEAQKCGENCRCSAKRCTNRPAAGGGSGGGDQTFTLPAAAAESAADRTFVVPERAGRPTKERRRTLLPPPPVPVDSPDLFEGSVKRARPMAALEE